MIVSLTMAQLVFAFVTSPTVFYPLFQSPVVDTLKRLPVGWKSLREDCLRRSLKYGIWTAIDFAGVYAALAWTTSAGPVGGIAAFIAALLQSALVYAIILFCCHRSPVYRKFLFGLVFGLTVALALTSSDISGTVGKTIQLLMPLGWVNWAFLEGVMAKNPAEIWPAALCLGHVLALPWLLRRAKIQFDTAKFQQRPGNQEIDILLPLRMPENTPPQPVGRLQLEAAIRRVGGKPLFQLDPLKRRLVSTFAISDRSIATLLLEGRASMARLYCLLLLSSFALLVFSQVAYDFFGAEKSLRTLPKFVFGVLGTLFLISTTCALFGLFVVRVPFNVMVILGTMVNNRGPHTLFPFTLATLVKISIRLWALLVLLTLPPVCLLQLSPVGSFIESDPSAGDWYFLKKLLLPIWLLMPACWCAALIRESCEWRFWKQWLKCALVIALAFAAVVGAWLEPNLVGSLGYFAAGVVLVSFWLRHALRRYAQHRLP